MIKTFFPDRDFAAFLFDFDGTIADTMPVHRVAWNQALGVYGLSLTLEQHLGWAGTPTRGIVKLLNELHNVNLPVDEILKNKEVHYNSSLSGIKEIVPVVEIIKANYKKIPMAVVSGSRRRPVETTLAHLNLTHYFDLLVCAEDYTKGKPAPDCFLKAAQDLNVKPEDCLVFEDAELGIAAAHAAGMQCLRVSEHAELGHDLALSVLPTRK